MTALNALKNKHLNEIEIVSNETQRYEAETERERNNILSNGMLVIFNRKV